MAGFFSRNLYKWHLLLSSKIELVKDLELTDTLKNIDIIRLFQEDPFSPMPTSEIEERLNLSHHPTFRRLKMLEKNGVIVKSDGGYLLNLQNEFVVEIMRFLSNIEKIDKNTVKNAQNGRDKKDK